MDATEENVVSRLARECGFECIGTTEASKLVAREEVRDMCAVNKCHVYDHNWACPPACGGIEDYQKKFSDYESCVVVQTVFDLEDEFDVENMMEAEHVQRERFVKLVEKVHEAGIPAMFLAAGTCTLCKECTYPDKPCRFPDKRLTSMEASGLVVGDVCTDAKIPYNHGQNTIAYSSCVIF